MGIDLRNITLEEYQKETTIPKVKNFGVLNLLRKDIHLFKVGLKDRAKERFYSELAVLLESGIDIKSALEIIVEEQSKRSDKILFKEISESVVQGTSLSEAIHQSKKFTPYEFYSIKIGEETGRLPSILKELTTFFNKKIKQRRQLTSALTYPGLVIITAFVAVIFMMKFIVPMFVDVFKRFHGTLPKLTRVIIAISDFLSDKIGLIFFIILLLIVLLIYLRRQPWFVKTYSLLVLKMPIGGDIIKKIYQARFCQSMALLIGSKIPLIQAIQLVNKMIGFYPFQMAMTKIESDIHYGAALYESMGKFKFFDRRIVYLTKVAEEVNKLDIIFNKLNEQYSEELQHRINLLNNLLEPVLIIIVGILVAIILIGMYLPLFQISSSIY
jgi:type IV pilus assembly protein PilC